MTFATMKTGSPKKYNTKIVNICRSIPEDLIPKLDEWLKTEKAKYLKTGKK
jgi:hypothetical protein